MDFNSIGNGQPFYILRQIGERPTLEVGTVKAKTAPRYVNQAVSGANFGTVPNVQQVINLTLDINGRDEVISDLPLGIEIASRGTDTYSGSKEAMLQAVEAMIQNAGNILSRTEFYRSVKTEGDKMREILNPQFARENQQARAIADLQKRLAEQDKKYDTILHLLQERKSDKQQN